MPLAQCGNCGKTFDTALIPDGMPQNCPYCGQENAVKFPPSLPVTSVVPAFPAVPRGSQGGEGCGTRPERVPCRWEREWRSSPFGAYFGTLREILRAPVLYFRTLKPFSDWVGWAVLVYVNNFLIVSALLAFQILIGIVPMALFGAGKAEIAGGLIGIAFFGCYAAFFPLVSLLMTFLGGLILHVFFKYIGGSEKGPETTMTLYGLSSYIGLFNIVPIAGAIAGLVYVLIIFIGGAAEAHDIPRGKAFLSWLLPSLICCCLIGGLIGMAVLIPALLAS